MSCQKDQSGKKEPTRIPEYCGKSLDPKRSNFQKAINVTMVDDVRRKRDCDRSYRVCWHVSMEIAVICENGRIK